MIDIKTPAFFRTAMNNLSFEEKTSTGIAVSYNTFQIVCDT